jgi:Rrf2 family transcriptional regulator, iron-sulfur cluster assembly transcription factor
MAQKYLWRFSLVMTTIKTGNDIGHVCSGVRFPSLQMVFSKSFGYALRGVLYVATMTEENRRVQVDEISKRLSVPKHFLGKIMNRIVKEGMLNSTKGPYGGFSVTDETLSSPLTRLLNVTDGMEQFNTCVLKLRKCNKANPCPLHYQMEQNRDELLKIFSQTTIADLLKQDKKSLIESIAIA